MHSLSCTRAQAGAQHVQVDVMVTAGANQAFTNLVCTLLDAEDAAVLFSPYYFNHLMALQARSCACWQPSCPHCTMPLTHQCPASMHAVT